MIHEPTHERVPSGPNPEELARIEAACDRYEDGCRRGDPPALEALWKEEGGGSDLLRELLVIELAYVLQSQRRPKIAEYLARFPGQAAAIEHAFAVTGASAEEETQTSNAGGDVPTVPPAQLDRQVVEALSLAGYTVVRELGRGGMGIVYEALQSAPARTVAVKVLRAGLMATDEESQRFLNEATAVARLEHPGIVALFEARRSRGLLYYSMQRISGESLAQALRRGPLDPDAAARLVANVARAVDHAHERGVLHRDIKPANILVDESGAPVLSDFGLARALDDAEIEATHSGLIVGTPAFMAPEQVAGKSRSLTTAVDIYGLGGVLYAALTGKAPHEGSSLASTLDNVRQTPPQPPSRVNAKVSRDLEAICLKCLDKDPHGRYTSARALAEDLDRWLVGEPTVARPVSNLTRARMWARRRPVVAGLLGALAASLLAGLVGIGWQWREANRQRLQAERLFDYLANRLLAQASTESNPQAANITVRALLDRQAARITGEFQDEPEVQAKLLETIGNTYDSLGLFEPAEKLLRQALTLITRLEGSTSPNTTRIQTRLGRVVAARGRHDEANTLLSQARATSLQKLGPDDPATLEATARLGAHQLAMGQRDAAEPLLREAYTARRRVLPTDHPDTLRSAHDLSRLLVASGRYAEAEPLANEFEYGIRCTRGPDHPDNVVALMNRGLIQRLRGKPDVALPLYRKAVDEAKRILGPDHPTTADALHEYNALKATLEKTRGSQAAVP
ncbi:MAG: serine/threonine-protein kinase [Isosphaeraceae bacterium]